jgi:acetolactate synthase-1/2/3 large subunit
MPSVADLILDGLVRAGVPRLFGVPREGSHPELLEAARARGVPFVPCRLEWAACIMAAVTGELTGRPGAALSALGPGVTASATGLAHACLDRAPLIYLSDRHPSHALDYTTHRYLDHAAHLGPIVKGSVLVSPESAGHWIAHAVRLALAEPRGPVHLDLPTDVVGMPAVPVAAGMTPAPPPMPDAGLTERAAEMIRAARHPVVIAGLGCRGADAPWLRAFAEALPAPVLTTRKAKGAIPDPHPLALGVFTGGALEEPLVRRADLIIAFGLDPVELTPRRRWPYSAPVLSLARCPWNDPRLCPPGGGAYFTPALEVIGAPGAILEDLAPRLVPRGTRADWDVALVDRIRRERAAALEVEVPGLAPHRVAQITRELTAAGSIATADAGAHVFPVSAYWHALEPGELLISNGLAAMGFALPAAIAAQLVHPDRRVVCFTGDTGLVTVAAELETTVRLRLPIIVVVFDDRAPPSVEGPDLLALARAFGLRALAATDEPTLRHALLAAQTAPGPTLIDARVDPSGYARLLEIVGGAPT